jgi:hypothetical protein
MYRPVFLSAALLFAAALQQVSAGELRSGPLTILLGMDSPASIAVIETMQREVEFALAPSGISIVWRRDPNANTESFPRLAMVRLRGDCRADAPMPRLNRLAAGDTEALGQTHVADGKVLPIADVRCDEVRAFIAGALAIPDERETLLGRALGRVMAHELYHVLLKTRHHGRSGLSRPAQSLAELLGARGAFAGPDERKLAESNGPPVSDGLADSGR